MTKLILLMHLFSCFFMTGLIWLIQLIHYPAMRHIKKESFSAFHLFHSQRITFIVGPVMTLEFATAVSIFFQHNLNTWSSLNLIGVLIIWGATAFLSVPAHNKLAQNYNEQTLQSLINTNWIRTMTWTGRSIFILYILATTPQLL